MPIKQCFITGYDHRDVEYFNNHSTPFKCDYKLKDDILIDASQMCSRLSNYSYEPIKLKRGSVFDGCDRTITVYYSKKNDNNPFQGVFDILHGTVKNLTIKVIDYVVLDDFCGWVNTKHSYIVNQKDGVIIPNRCVIINCSTNGSNNGVFYGGCGGITGAGAGAGCSLESNIRDHFDCDDTDDTNNTNETTVRCLIKDCKTMGDILSVIADGLYPIGCGGIAGAYPAVQNGSCQIIDCQSAGRIGKFCGGITTNSGDACEVVNCVSFGDMIGFCAGGIIGLIEPDKTNENGNFAKTCVVKDCESFGSIGLKNIEDKATDCGGIIGASVSINNIPTISQMIEVDPNAEALPTLKSEIINCASHGNINGDRSGGIVGSFSDISGDCMIINCTSSGDIDGNNAGGIVGSNAGGVNICTIQNCSSSGSINGIGSGGIAGSLAGSIDHSVENNARISPFIPAPTGHRCYIGNCSSSGHIIGKASGGIVGTAAGVIIENDTGKDIESLVTCEIIASVSGGDIKGEFCGGIAGGYTNGVIFRISNDIAKVIAKSDINNARDINTFALPPTTITTTIAPEISGLFINNSMATASNCPLACGSARIIGSIDSDIINPPVLTLYITNTYYYADVIDNIAGNNVIQTVDIENYPSKTLQSIHQFCDKDNIKAHEYDGIHSLAFNNHEKKFHLSIKKLYFNKNNVHPLSYDRHNEDSPLVRAEAYDRKYDCNKLFFKFTLKLDPSQETVRFWIPNSVFTDSYSLFYANVDRDMIRLGDLITVGASSSLWSFTFPNVINHCKERIYDFYVIKNDASCTL